ncbi:MAG: YkgJ family cysteine cluster protein [Verrucomicrobiota bacterium]
MTTPPTHYQCQRCANCCRWPGEVVLTTNDIQTIARFLHLTETEFIENYTRLRQNRTGLSLTEKPDGACEFLHGIDCTINDAKPAQCRDFPNKWNFPGWRQVCEAIPVPAPSAPANS